MGSTRRPAAQITSQCIIRMQGCKNKQHEQLTRALGNSRIYTRVQRAPVSQHCITFSKQESRHPGATRKTNQNIVFEYKIHMANNSNEKQAKHSTPDQTPQNMNEQGFNKNICNPNNQPMHYKNARVHKQTA